MSAQTHTQALARPLQADRAAEWLIALGALMIGSGGVLLGVQVDANRGFSGTGYAAFALGGVIALVSTIVRARGSQGLPRDFHGAFAALAAFLGLTFVAGGVLAPGGPWMFAEFAVLLMLAMRRPREGSRWISSGALWLMVALFVFRLWITYQGGRNHWQVLSVPIPILSWLPFDFLAPIQSVSLGSFTPWELGLPPAGVDFPITLGLWTGGFALCSAGIFVVQLAAREHENDRVHDVIHTLPAPLAGLVERLLPEEEWETLGLHGLATRMLCKRIEALVRERAQRQRDITAAVDRAHLLRLSHTDGFSGSIQSAIVDFESGADRRAEE
ncbi:MAG: hypothetical protein IPJ19_05275 [Planctomycetes bacterium]|nr:hypothetical protein [Planctomycetota bacterium]